MCVAWSLPPKKATLGQLAVQNIFTFYAGNIGGSGSIEQVFIVLWSPVRRVNHTKLRKSKGTVTKGK